MKLALLAFACEPNRTSEPGVGWHVAAEMSSRHQTTVITRANNQEVIEKFLKYYPEHPCNTLTFLYYDLPHWICVLKKKIPYGAQLYQELWNLVVARKYRTILEKFDIVHQVTFGAAFFTPYAARFCKRFVWGPIGGGDYPIPFSFLLGMGLKSCIMETIYRFATHYACRGSLIANYYRRRASAIVFRTREFKERMRSYGQKLLATSLETAYTDVVEDRNYDEGARPLRILMLGRLLPHKGVVLSVKAFSEFLRQGGEGELVVCGSGVLDRKLRSLAKKLAISDSVQFMGQTEHNEAMRIMGESDVLLHLSFREGGSWSILEAMAHGLPIICQGKSGMDDMVGEDCGAKIKANDAKTLIKEAAAVLFNYWRDRSIITLHGKNAQNRVKKEFKWEHLADKLDKVDLELIK